MITPAYLHHLIINEVIDKGFAPDVAHLSEMLSMDRRVVVEALYDLQDHHGVVLHPNEPKIWVIHPFSLAPTNFYVTSDKGEWWGNCAWCSLGIAALIDQDVTIKTVIGAETKQIEINLRDGEIQEKDFLIHFPVSMKKAWDNVLYTCSNMLIFENETQVNKWSLKHNIPQGDLQPIETIWKLSKKWYGNHLDPNWTKWTIEEAKAIFAEFGLVGDTWNLDSSNEFF